MSSDEPRPQGISRRNALQGLAAGAVAVAALGEASPAMAASHDTATTITKTPYKVAVVTAASVEFDLKASVEKAVDLITTAAAAGARVVAFGELWLPGYPKDINYDTTNFLANGVAAYQRNALRVGGPAWSAIAAAAKNTNTIVEIGYAERAGSYLYMGQTVFGTSGKPLIVRRKIRPSGSERLLFSDDPIGHNIKVVNTTLGRIGALECWEHLHPVMTFDVEAQQESVHFASWPYNSLPGANVQWWEDVEVALSASRMYAITSGSYVLLSGVGFGAVFAPTGTILAQTSASPAEDLLYSTVDPSGFTTKSYNTTGEYSWGVLNEIRGAYPGPRVRDSDHQSLNKVVVPR